MTRKKSESLLFGLKKMRFQKTSFPGKICWPEKGGVSMLFSIFVFLVLALFALVSSSMVTLESRSSANFAQITEAQYLAEAGIQYGIGLALAGESLPYAEIVPMYGGEFRLTLVDLTTFTEVTSLGIFGDTKKTIEVLLGSADFSETKAAVSGNDVKFQGGSGTVTGGVHGNNAVIVDLPNSVDGPITTAPPAIPPPVVDWLFFKNKAIAAGQFVAGDKTFNNAGSPYTGVWYLEGKAFFTNNSELKGTIVAENDVEFDDNIIKVTATPRRMPAVVCGNSVKNNGTNLVIKGLIYSANDFVHSGINMTVLGAIIAVNTVDGSGLNKTITLDLSYTTDISGLGVPGNLEIASWKEL